MEKRVKLPTAGDELPVSMGTERGGSAMKPKMKEWVVNF
jgi:hypothetical protein